MTLVYAVTMDVSYFNEGPANNYFIQSQFPSAPFLSFLLIRVKRSSRVKEDKRPAVITGWIPQDLKTLF